MNRNWEPNGSGASDEHDDTHHEYTLDEAIKAAKIGKYQVMLIALTGLCLLGVSIENMNISMVLPYLKCDLKLTNTEESLLRSACFLGIVSSSMIWGFLADNWGRQKVLSLASFGGFVFTFPFGFISNVNALICLRFLAGAMLAGAQAGAYSYIQEFHTAKTGARAIAFSNLCMNGVVVFLSVPALLIIPMDFNWEIFGVDFKSWRFYFVFTSSINLWNGIVFALLPESPKFLLSNNRNEEALSILRRMYTFNTGESPEDYPVESIKVNAIRQTLNNQRSVGVVIRLFWLQTKRLFLPPLLSSTWRLCYLIFVIYACSHGILMWFPNFLVRLQYQRSVGREETLCQLYHNLSFEEKCKHITLDNQNIPVFEILLGSGMFFFSTGVLASILMQKISPKVILNVWFMISLLACFALDFLTEHHSIVTSCILYLSIISAVGTVMAVGVNSFSTKNRGMATAVVLLFGRIGSGSGSNVVGLLLTYNCSAIFYLNCALLISCMIIFSTFKPKDHSRLPQK